MQIRRPFASLRILKGINDFQNPGDCVPLKPSKLSECISVVMGTPATTNGIRIV